MTTSPTENPSTLLDLSNHLAHLVEQAGHSVVAVNARRRRSSSGVYWRSGIVVTAEHAINREDEISVTLPNQKTATATLVGRDPGTDLAVLRLDETSDSPLQVATLADAAALKIGNLVLAIARSPESGISTSMGVISSLGGSWRSWQGGRIDQLIRPALMLYPGFSGGALITTGGEVIGINTAGPRHHALTIPATTVNRVVDQLLQGGRVARGYLGLGMQPVRLPEGWQRSLSLSQNTGVIVVSIEAGMPADQAEILMGDILIALDNTAINDVGDVLSMLDGERIGKPLNARIIRGGNLLELPIIVGERPTQEV
jgi:S1-C subfamily serine protease